MANDQKVESMVEFEKTRVNLWNVIGFGTIIFGLGVSWAVQTTRADRMEQDLKAINAQIPTIAETQFEIRRLRDTSSENRAMITANNNAVNERIDRIVNSIDTRLAGIGDSVTTLITRVEVLTTRFDATPQRSVFMRPIANTEGNDENGTTFENIAREGQERTQADQRKGF